MLRARDNPFATDRILQLRYRPLDESLAELRSRLLRMNLRCAIVGPRGAGKTTLMEDLADWLATLGYRPRQIRLSLESRRFSLDTKDLGEKDVVFLDGADLIGWFRWKWFLFQTREAGGLIIASHKPGLLPTLIQCRTTPRVLLDLVSRLNPPARLLDENLVATLYYPVLFTNPRYFC
jgi:hypothetical protein